MQNYIRINPPEYTDFISLADAKDHLKIDDESEDDLVTDYLASAHRAIELEAGVLIGTQTWVVQLNCLSSYIRLQMQPIQSISSIKYWDIDNVEQTINAANYRLIAPTRGTAVIEFDYAYQYPVTYPRLDSVTVQFVAGSTNNEVAKRAIRLQLGSDHENREGQGGNELAIRRACHQLRGY